MLHYYSLSYFMSLNPHSWVMLSLYIVAAKINKNDEFEGLCVHGLLTNLQAFHFYLYDQSWKKFAFNETLQASTTREIFMADMVPGTWFSHLVFWGLIFFHSDK